MNIGILKPSGRNPENRMFSNPQKELLIETKHEDKVVV